MLRNLPAHRAAHPPLTETARALLVSHINKGLIVPLMAESGLQRVRKNCDLRVCSVQRGVHMRIAWRSYIRPTLKVRNFEATELQTMATHARHQTTRRQDVFHRFSFCCWGGSTENTMQRVPCRILHLLDTCLAYVDGSRPRCSTTYMTHFSHGGQNHAKNSTPMEKSCGGFLK